MNVAGSRYPTRNRPAIPIWNEASSLSRGLLSFIAAPKPIDLVQQLPMTGTLAQSGFGSIGGTGWQFNANDQGMRATALPTVKVNYPVTVAAHILYTGTPTANSNIFGVSYDNALNNPFLAYSVFVDSTNKFNIAANYGGTFQAFVTPLITPSTWTLYSVIATIASGAQSLFVNGVSGGTATQTGNPSYGTGPIIAAGEYVGGFTRNDNMIFYDGMIWNRLLSANERAMLDFGSPWDLYLKPSRRVYVFQSSATRHQWMPLLGVN